MAEKVPARRNIRLDLSDASWDWFVQQAMELGVPLGAYAKTMLAVAAPVAQDPDVFNAKKRALFEARQSVFGFLRRVIDATYAEFMRDPRSFMPANHAGPPPDALASLPAWEEPDDQGRHGRNGGGNFP